MKVGGPAALAVPAKSSRVRKPPPDSPHDKELGAYYTPPDVVRCLVGWANDTGSKTLVDPSCGDGRFLEDAAQCVGVDISSDALVAANSKAPQAELVHADFFEWAAATKRRFEVAVGNPPFIRYHRFSGRTRAGALNLCRKANVDLPALSSSWAPFIIGASTLLEPGGRIAFVVPAEISYAVYARPLLKWLIKAFGRVEIVAIKEKLFPELSEDCWLLRARDYGRPSAVVHFAQLDTFNPDETAWQFNPITTAELSYFNYRLRPFLLDAEARAVYRQVAESSYAVRLGEVATLGIGYVTGANDFFHLSPSHAKRLRIPTEFLSVALRSNKGIGTVRDVDERLVQSWIANDRPVLLLNLGNHNKLPAPVRRYLNSPEGQIARESYKCRNRDPWYAVPDVRAPDAFLSIMSHDTPRLVGNSAAVVCTNSVLGVRFKTAQAAKVVQQWDNLLTRLSCEIEGHGLGGGLLKLEPAEAREVTVPNEPLRKATQEVLQTALANLTLWRNGKETRSAKAH